MVFMLKKLTKREKYAIYALSGAAVLFILIQFVIFPSIDKRRRLKRTIQVKENLLLEMINLKSDYDAVEKRTSLAKVNFENREKDFTLFSFLDSLTGKARIKEYVTYMKPSTTVQKNNSYKISQVEMKFKGLTLEQLTTYLHMVETSKNMVRIERLSISKTGKQEGFVDAVLQVEAVEK
jgi:general secretion pathway protein M